MNCIECNGTGMFDDGAGERTASRCNNCDGSGREPQNIVLTIGFAEALLLKTAVKAAANSLVNEGDYPPDLPRITGEHPATTLLRIAAKLEELLK